MLDMKYAKIGEDVIVIKRGVEAYDHICQIWKIGEYVDGAPKISVSDEGNIYNFHPEYLLLA